MKIKILLVFLLAAFSLSAKVPFSIGDKANKLSGAITHSWRKLWYKDMDKRLKPENEEEIHLIAEKMGITPDELIVCANPQQLKSIGPHCTGNRVYFDDDWFDMWADAPHVKQFIIGHELSHLKKVHCPKRGALSFLMTGVYLYHTFRSVGPWYTYFMSSDDNEKSDALWSSLKNFGISFCFNIAFGLTKSALNQSQEYEADANALEQLGPIYGNELIAQGAGEYFSAIVPFKPYTIIHKLLHSHPHSIDRLKKLNMSQDISEEAGEKMLTLLKKRLILRLSELFGAFDSKVFAQNWLAICSAARLCSTYDSVTDGYDKKLQSIPDLFSILVESIKTGSFDSTVLEKDFAREDIDQLEELVRTKGLDKPNQIDPYRKAIQDELAGLSAVLKRKQ